MGTETFLSVRGVSKTFVQRRRWGPEGGGAASQRSVEVLRDISFDLERGRTLGLVGPSGAGKSTLARCLALFEEPSGGTIRLEGRNLWSLSRRERRAVRAEIQLIVQQPAASLNPRFTAGQIVSEPLLIQNRGTAGTRLEIACELMEMVGLPREAVDTPALAFSGGQRQRLAIARALALEPKLLILDESFSGLDLSIQAQVIVLLSELQKRRDLTYILISHDLAVAADLADEIGVMNGGIIVEHRGTAELLADPQDACTRGLLEASMALAFGGPAA